MVMSANRRLLSIQAVVKSGLREDNLTRRICTDWVKEGGGLGVNFSLVDDSGRTRYGRRTDEQNVISENITNATLPSRPIFPRAS